ncbi:OmpA family protein [Longibacter salinarum]|nr:OmpA family protein [Longibacter salinarum]
MALPYPMRMLALALTIVLASLFSASAHAQETQPVRIEDEQGNTITFEVGEKAFADTVTSFDPGDPMSKQTAEDGTLALGLPNYERGRGIETAITLGCGGVLELQFTDNVLIDREGPDLHVFEVGPDVEPTFVSVSTDGNEWNEVGGIEGGTASVDISDVADAGDVFRFVRLTDDGEDCSGNYPGADIDAVGAIHASQVIELAGALLFDLDSSALRAEAKVRLREIAETLEKREVESATIVGHTDSQGSAAYNDSLSLERAQSVRTYLTETLDVSGIEFTVRGAGASEPVAPNDTAEGRRRNRRVEFIF